MDTVVELAKINYITTILGFFAILFAVKEIIELFTYFKNKFRIKTGNEEDKETVEERLTGLEERITKLESCYTNLHDDIKEIIRLLNEREEEERERIVTEYGAKLYSMHDEFVKHGFTTRAGLEAFQLMADTYIAKDGNHLIKKKIIPEVYALPVHSDLYGEEN